MPYDFHAIWMRSKKMIQELVESVSSYEADTLISCGAERYYFSVSVSSMSSLAQWHKGFSLNERINKSCAKGRLNCWHSKKSQQELPHLQVNKMERVVWCARFLWCKEQNRGSLQYIQKANTKTDDDSWGRRKRVDGRVGRIPHFGSTTACNTR